MKFKILTTTLLSLFIVGRGWSLTIEEAIERASQGSKIIQMSQFNYDSAAAYAESVDLGRRPKLSIDGSFRYQNTLPTIQVGPTQLATQDYNSYSVGPTLSYALWDSGLKGDLAKAAEAQAGAKHFQIALNKVQLRLATRIAYVKAVLNLRLKEISLSVASLVKSQNSDIRAKRKSGSASDLDQLISDSDVLNYQLKLKQSQTSFENSITDLSYYVSGDADNSNESKIEDLEPLEHLLKNTKIPIDRDRILDHPILLSQTKLLEGSRLLMSAQRAGYWPTLNIWLRSSIDYPVGVPFSKVTQNSLGLSLNWTLWDFGTTTNLVSAKSADLMAAQLQLDEHKKILTRDYERSRNQLSSLENQIIDAASLVEKQNKIAQLNYQTYKYGKLSYSEVQTSNLRLLEAQSRLATTQAQFLIELFNLKYFVEKE
jgi:outer membrane protein TolC